MSNPLHEHLLSLGFNNDRLPYQYHSENEPSYYIVDLDTDSDGFHIFSICNKRYDSTSFRGAISSPEDFDKVFAMVKEDYNRTDKDKALLKPVSGDELKNAIQVLISALREDDKEGSYFYAWQANIAVQFQDLFKYNTAYFNGGQPIAIVNQDDVHRLSNEAAKNFLNLLIRQ